LEADLTSHHIEGLAIHGNTPFSCPLISYVGQFGEGTLHQGGCFDGVEVDFDVIVSLYNRERFRFNGHTFIEAKMYDASGEVPTGQVLWLAEQVAMFLDQGQRVLVHCQAGLNRSSLVVGAYLIRHAGMTGAEAITAIRKRSDACLCNPDFELWIRSLGRPDAPAT